jgi:ectoine hydroxylase-related dioxygenase (phytanoyl-CoA dioxygenase family)
MDLRENLAADFEDKGAAMLGRVLNDEQLATAREAGDEAFELGVEGPYARIVHDPWRKSAALAGLVPHLGRLTCAALGIPELVLFHDHLLFKPPGGVDMDWHQDFSYLPLDRADGLTLWIALDDITPENGCLYYLFGSHLLGERRAGWGMTGEDDPRASLPPMDVAPDEGGEPAATAAGCAIAHHGNLWHRSPANRSGQRRRSWALSFVSPEARWSPRHSPHPRSAVEPRFEGQAMEEDLLRVCAEI